MRGSAWRRFAAVVVGGSGASWLLLDDSGGGIDSACAAAAATAAAPARDDGLTQETWQTTQLMSQQIHDNGVGRRERATVQLPDGKTLRLTQVQAYFRHGARTPLHSLPGYAGEVHWDEKMCNALPDTERALRITDVNNGPLPINPANLKQKYNKLPGGCHVGCLTLLGRFEALNLGQRLRDRYIDDLEFISASCTHPTDRGTYIPQDVYVRSTNFDRTIETTRLVVSGLFGANDNSNTGLHVQIRTVGRDEEFLSPNTYACPRLRQLFREAKRVMEVNRPSHVKKFIAELASILSVTEKEVRFITLRDVISCRQAHSKDIPRELVKSKGRINELAIEDSVAFFRYNFPEAIKLSMGRMFQNLLSLIDSSIRGDASVARMNLFGCHDTTIFPLLLALGIFDDRWPPFAGDVCIELYHDINSVSDYYVRLTYCGNALQLPIASSEFCPYKDFQSLLSGFIPADMAEACKPKERESMNKHKGENKSVVNNS
eukprot:gene1568-4716_t